MNNRVKVFKNILLTWLIIYAVFTFITIIQNYSTYVSNKLGDLNPAALKIVSMIIFAYIGIRGNKKIAWCGIISIWSYVLFYLIYDVFNGNIIPLEDATDRVVYFLYAASYFAILLCELFVVLSLVRKDRKCVILIMCSMVFTGVYSLIYSITALMPLDDSDNIYTLSICCQYLGYLFEYAAIIIYLYYNNFKSILFDREGDR